MTDLREAAEALMEHVVGDLPTKGWLRDTNASRAAIAAIRAALAAPALPEPAVKAGWRLVPVEPTEAMNAAGGHANSEWLNDNAPIGEKRYAMPMPSVWQAMLAATPEIAETGAAEMDHRESVPSGTDPASPNALGAAAHAEQMARRFHEAYERFAPQFGYTTRPETREFDPESPNGKLMIAVCAALSHQQADPTEG